jgi:hypothetical protein
MPALLLTENASKISLKRTIDPLAWNYSAESVKGTSIQIKQVNKSIEEAR